MLNGTFYLDGRCFLVKNPFQERINFKTANNPLMKPKVRKSYLRGENNIYPAAIGTGPFVDKYKEDKEVKDLLLNFTEDFIENAFSPLIEAVFEEIMMEDH